MVELILHLLFIYFATDCIICKIYSDYGNTEQDVFVKRRCPGGN